MHDAIVIGSGVSGLSCASELADAGLRVQVWTAAPPEQTTSRVAAAFWYPFRVDPVERVVPWSAHSYERFAELAADPQLGPQSGVLMREALEIFPTPVPDPPWSRAVDLFRYALPEELPPGYGHGLVFTAPVIEMPRYLPWLAEQVTAAGVEILIRRLDSLAPALAAAPIVVNTTGLGARELVDDARVYPLRGQILSRSRGALDRVLIDEHSERGITYVVPRSEDVILGGVSDEDSTELREDPEQSAAIFERCASLEPQLRASEALDVFVGLRPCRDEVRLEAERVDGRLVIHNYGHGGAGVTLSWGCAAEVRELATGRSA
ncbi:FAD-dependent oxidoreductase [Pseudenhygromyxa sp. WMMC2535]|uniref:FAD-dependent oxidoreductase n=1 Tax=Pseudenhygromyxa sp. WMMC2535 TaxID=2712867 RepID=UPI00155192E1|nr:FAD-dependent oxidoreductase [Pseudenhygromyxa sp. WMMC2535]NVB38724.1 FAD-dependent oxidoreductase [Pseudenhygromyxa sp. WMMC2535]